MNKKKILILGASSDIGIKVVERFLKDGFYIIAHYNKNKKKLSKFKGQNIEFLKFDLRKINKLEKFISQKGHKLNFSYFLSLTGYMKLNSFLNFKIADFCDHLNVNYLSSILFIRKVLTKMQKNNFGRILLTTSIGTKYGGGINNYMYSLTKFMNEFIPMYIRKISQKNISFNVMQIGLTDTKLILKDKKKNLKKRISLIPIKRMAKADEVADYIFHTLKRDNVLLTNNILNISGGE